MTDKAVIEGLKKGDPKALDFIYTTHRLTFMRFAKKYPLTENTIADVYQDAVIALRENALNGKLDHLKNRLNTYLFSIGKYMIYAKLKQKSKMYAIENVENLDFEEEHILDVEELTHQQKQLHVAFKKLGEKCKSVLTLFYYRGFDIEDIKNELNYPNKDVVKSQKSRCIKSLKDMILKT